MTGTALCVAGVVLSTAGYFAGGKDFTYASDHVYVSGGNSSAHKNLAVMKKEQIDDFTKLNVDFEDLDLDIRTSDDDHYYMEYKLEKNGKKVAVIGSGPAGITVAIKLALAGYKVTIFEERSKIGGMLQYGIPEFRLSKSVIDRYKKKMEELGIRIRPNTVIGSAIVIDNLFRDGYSSVFVGTGVWRPKAIGIKGESLGNVYFGIDYLRRPEAHQLGEKVAVIGMGNVAMDVARTALRHGAKEVTLYARGKRISASSHEVSYTKLEGADFVFGKAIESINEAGPMF